MGCIGLMALCIICSLSDPLKVEAFEDDLPELAVAGLALEKAEGLIGEPRHDSCSRIEAVLIPQAAPDAKESAIRVGFRAEAYRAAKIDKSQPDLAPDIGVWIGYRSICLDLPGPGEWLDPGAPYGFFTRMGDPGEGKHDQDQ